MQIINSQISQYIHRALIQIFKLNNLNHISNPKEYLDIIKNILIL